MTVQPQLPEESKILKFREVFRRWDWLLTVAIAPVMLFPDVRQPWALIAIPLVLVVQGLAWGEILPVTPLNPAILLLAIMAGVSTFITPDPAGSLGKITGLLFGIAVYFCAARHTRTKQGWTGSLLLFILAGTGIALLGLAGTNWATTKYFWLNSLTSYLPVRLSGLPGAETGIHPNELAGSLVWVFPVIFMAGLALVSESDWFSRRSAGSKLRLPRWSGWAILLTIAFLISLGVLVLSQTRGGYLAIGLTGLVLMMILIPEGSKRWWAIGVLAAIGIGGVILVQQIGWGTIQGEVIGNTPSQASAISLDSLNLEGRNLVTRNLGDKGRTPDRIGDERFPKCYIYTLSHLYSYSKLHHRACPQ